MLLFPDQENGQAPNALSLTNAVESYLGRPLIGAHGALADTLATMQLLKAMVGDFPCALALPSQPFQGGIVADISATDTH